MSITYNKAEGIGRKHNKEIIQLPNIALGSSSETETRLLIPKKYILHIQASIRITKQSIKRNFHNADWVN